MYNATLPSFICREILDGRFDFLNRHVRRSVDEAVDYAKPCEVGGDDEELGGLSESAVKDPLFKVLQSNPELLL